MLRTAWCSIVHFLHAHLGSHMAIEVAKEIKEIRSRGQRASWRTAAMRTGFLMTRLRAASSCCFMANSGSACRRAHVSFAAATLSSA